MTGLLNNGQTLQKKIKTPPPHNINLNCFCHCTSGTFAFAATTQANAEAKELLLPTLCKNIYLPLLISNTLSI